MVGCLSVAVGACGAQEQKFVEDASVLDEPDANLPDDAGEGVIDDASEPPPDPDEPLFGIVYPSTGLTEERCAPVASRTVVDAQTGRSKQSYFTGLYTQAQIARLQTMVLAADSPHFSKLPFLPADLMNDSPWNHLDQYETPTPGTVCGLKIVDDSNPDALRYSLDTYASKAEAEADGARVTHLSSCGHCSSVADLTVLLTIPDRTLEMRECALKLLSSGGKASVLSCIQEVGLSETCSQVLYFNALYTQQQCLMRCLAHVSANYHNPDGTLNDCMVCNAEKADELYKILAGRRDDGQPISMCRALPEEEWICHNYADDFDNPESCIEVDKPTMEWTCTTDDYDESNLQYDLGVCIQPTPGDGEEPDDKPTHLDEPLFGIAHPKSGLTEAWCAPAASRTIVDEQSGEEETRYFTGLYTQAQIARLQTMVLAEDSPHLSKLPFLPADLNDDSPWDHLDQYEPPSPGAVCGLKIVDASDPDALRYSLDTYASKAEAEADSARVTHLGNCGHCSSIADLAISLAKPDRTLDIRNCALQMLTGGGKPGVLSCVRALGLSETCSQVLYFNTLYTLRECTMRCLAYFDANYYNPDGTLNDCMTCYEENADELYEVLAGRHADGQPTSLCRALPEEEWICHNYADDFDKPEACVGVDKPTMTWGCTIADYDTSTSKYDLGVCIQPNE
ncbi:MAG: hypothetical protein LBM75_06525 [Myxococcales bacterium]|nr:hypothetical protein [Myxococcales bacterium]